MAAVSVNAAPEKRRTTGLGSAATPMQSRRQTFAARFGERRQAPSKPYMANSRDQFLIARKSRRSLVDIAVNTPNLAAVYEGERTNSKETIKFMKGAFLEKTFLLRTVFYGGLSIIILTHPCFIESNVFLDTLDGLSGTLSFFTVFLSFALVFRTQICYTRWWEGRCLWGALIFAAINLAQQGQHWIKDKEKFRRLCCSIVALPYACKAQLREASIQKVDGRHLLERGIMNKEELEAVEEREGWQPYYFLGAMRAVISSDLEKNSRVDREVYLDMGYSLNQLAKSIGGLIRVKATGLPYGYDMFFHAIYTVFFIVASIAWTPSLGWYTVIVIGVMRAIIRLVFCLGLHLMDPFGHGITNLPLHNYCLAIETQVEAVFHDKFQSDQIGGNWPFSLDPGALMGGQSSLDTNIMEENE